MAKTVSIRYLVLGLITRQPMSGYDIKRFLNSLSWLVGTPSFGSLYPILHTLREKGLVTVEAIPRQDKPPRKIYTITDNGKQVLREWIDQPIAAEASLRDFVMRLILSNNFSHTGLIAHLQQRRSQVITSQATLKQIIESRDETMDWGQRLAFGYGLSLATAELTWLDSTLELLSQQPLPMEVVKGDGVTSAV
ncbi:MAG: PadR family transcriptional regulator [Chloroflexi bacterium]|nr:PadR family transcriptional regulator [Chloroflexota bacterium]